MSEECLKEVLDLYLH